MVTKATVIQTEGRIAIVETKRLSACDGCHKQLEGESCSVCSLMGGNTTLTSRADNSIGARVGDVVEIESDSGRILGYAALVFLAPVVLALLLYFAASPFLGGTVALGVAFAGLVLAFGGIGLFSKLVIAKRCDVRIVSICHNDKA